MTESPFSKKEKEILRFWQDNNIFEKSVAKKSPLGDYVFYDGPPFATGLPHYGHFPSSIMKDVVPRYFTMRGFRVERKWGWDCHGLPIENIVEKELGFKNKKEIIDYGIDKFSETCRSKVLTYASEWEKTIPRLGRWADMKNAYKTMDLDFMESVWWVFKQLWDKKLIYQDYQSMHVCPRCETTLSQQEVSEGYKTIKDWSVIVKFELVDEPGTYVLSWTTTPWTLPGNVTLAVGDDITYSLVKLKATNQNVKFNEHYIIAWDLVEKIFGEYEYEILQELKVKDLVGRKYKPLFDDYQKIWSRRGPLIPRAEMGFKTTELKFNEEQKKIQNAYTIAADDFVTTDEGTGIVHIAPAFGIDDMRIGKKYQLPFVQHVNMDGTIKPEIKEFAGLSVKPIDDHQSTDVEIIKNLAAKGLLFSKEKYEHSYPHCWRCDTPLINYATSSWFVQVTKIKTDLLQEAKKVNWSPAHIKEGRFGKWLAGARDWSISRQRFWASVMPIWQCNPPPIPPLNKGGDGGVGCGAVKVYGSIVDLEKDSGQKITDLHKHIIDKVTIPCEKCGGVMRRVPDVLDTWFDSGSMPYAQMHYPFENKKKFEDNFPAEFIAEGIDQTRAWFYYLHVIGVALKKIPAFKNVVVNGIVLAEDGKKMSKKLQNYPDPNEVMDRYGADALRFYLLTTPVMEAENLIFSEKGVKEALQKNVMLLENILNFYKIYQKEKLGAQSFELRARHILDRWILAKLNLLISEVTEKMDSYQLVRAARPITEFINELSTWYVRRSRQRFRDGDQAGVQTLGSVLHEFSKVIAPFMPFIAERIYQAVSTVKESVHLEDWPAYTKISSGDTHLLEDMELARKVVEQALAARSKAVIKIRQPIASLKFKTQSSAPKTHPPLAEKLKTNEELLDIIKNEVNVKEIVFDDTIENEVEIDTHITPDLKLEGQAREIIRQVNNFRKERGFHLGDKVVLYQSALDEVFDKFGEEIKKATYLAEVRNGEGGVAIEVEGGKISLKKV